MKKTNLIDMLSLHLLFGIYSLSSVCSKKAALTEFLSLSFCLFYCGVVIFLMIYAIGWQQIIKRLPLTVAFANKAMTVIWGAIWGVLLFNETISIWKLVGMIVVVFGIILFSQADGEFENE